MSNHDNQDTRSPDEIESDIQQTRSHLDSTLHQLEDRLSPDQMMNTALEYVRSSGSKDFFVNLGETVKQNPVPVALMGLGIGWLMYSNSSAKRGTGGTGGTMHSSTTPSPSTTTTSDPTPMASSEAPGTASPATVSAAKAPVPTGDTAPNVATSGSATSHTATPGLGGGGSYTNTSNYSSDYRSHHATGGHDQGRMGAIKGKASGLVSGVKDKASGLIGGAKGKFSGSGGHMREKVSGMRSGNSMQGISHKAQSMGPQITEFIKEHPVVVGALGVALGAALGGMLPSTRTERKTMGGVRDDVMNRASEAGQEQLDKAKAKANELKEQAKGTVEEKKEEVKNKSSGDSSSTTGAADTPRSGGTGTAPGTGSGTATTGGLGSTTATGGTARPTTTSEGIQGTRSVSASPSSYTDSKKDDKR